MQKLGMEDGEAIEHKWVTKAIENAQRKVEGHNFDIRKHLLEYDDVANDQRKVVYEQRDELMETESVLEYVNDIRDEVVPGVVESYIPTGTLVEQWDLDGLEGELLTLSGEKFDVKGWLEENPDLPEADIATRVLDTMVTNYDAKVERAGEEQFRRFEKFVMLQALDEHWKDHLGAMDYLRQSVSLRGYAQKNPKQEYKREAFELFNRMLDGYKREVMSKLATVQIRDAAEVEAAEASRKQATQATEVTYKHESADSALDGNADRAAGAGGSSAVGHAGLQPFVRGAARGASGAQGAGQGTGQAAAQGHGQGAGQTTKSDPFVRGTAKVGRNEPCPCGSGKKFKQCHGKLG